MQIILKDFGWSSWVPASRSIPQHASGRNLAYRKVHKQFVHFSTSILYPNLKQQKVLNPKLMTPLRVAQSGNLADTIATP